MLVKCILSDTVGVTDVWVLLVRRNGNDMLKRIERRKKTQQNKVLASAGLVDVPGYASMTVHLPRPINTIATVYAVLWGSL